MEVRSASCRRTCVRRSDWSSEYQPSAQDISHSYNLSSGLNFPNTCAGIYADAFPLYLNWYPSLNSVLLPQNSPPVSMGMIAFTSRNELGEGMATLITKGLRGFPSIQSKTRKTSFSSPAKSRRICSQSWRPSVRRVARTCRSSISSHRTRLRLRLRTMKAASLVPGLRRD